MKTPTHIWIFKSNDPQKQRAMQEMWRKIGLTMICEFAATGCLDDEMERLVRREHPDYLDPIDQGDLVCFFGRVDGRPVAP